MPLRILEATEADLPELNTIFLNTFLVHVGIERLLYPDSATESVVASSLEHMRAERAKPTTIFVKVVDTALAPPHAKIEDYRPVTIVAMAKWNVFPDPRPRAAWDVPYARPDGKAAGVNRALMDVFMTGITQRRARATRGRPHVHMGLLATRLGYERRGAGRMLVQWGLDTARHLGVDCYLEATPQGFNLYEKMGFEVFDRWDLDVEPYGGEGTWPTWWMWMPLNERSRERGPWVKEDEDLENGHINEDGHVREIGHVKDGEN